MFSWTSRNSRVPPDNALEEISRNHVHSTKAAISWRNNTWLTSGFSRHVRSLLAAERKRSVRPSRGEKRFWRRLSLWRQEAPLLGHVAISLPVWGFLGKFSFAFIYFISFLRYCLFYFFLIPTTLRPIYIYIYIYREREEERERDGCIDFLEDRVNLGIMNDLICILKCFNIFWL